MSVRTANLAAKLQESKPEPIGQSEWNENQKELENRFFTRLYEDSSRADSPLSFIKRQDLSVLQEDNRELLLKGAYRAELRTIPNLSIESNAAAFISAGKPQWITDDDWKAYKESAERTLRVAKKEPLYNLIESIVSSMPLSKREVDKLDPEIQEKLVKMDEEIRLKKDKNRNEAEQLSNQAKEIAIEKEKILRQLKILNDLFKDPSSLDRIESYDNPFAPGNFELLKLVSKDLRSAIKR